MEPTTKEVAKKRTRSRFWVGPLMAGTFLAIGHGATQRFLILKSSWEKPVIESFSKKQPFPGKSLESLRQEQTINISSNTNQVFTRIQDLSTLQKKEKKSFTSHIESSTTKPIQAEKISKSHLKQKFYSLNPPDYFSKNNFHQIKEKSVDELFESLPKP